MLKKNIKDFAMQLYRLPILYLADMIYSYEVLTFYYTYFKCLLNPRFISFLMDKT